MRAFSRLLRALRRGRVRREIDAELESHIAEAVANGISETEARRAMGSLLRLREESMDWKLIPRVESLRADVVVGWRRLRQAKMTSAAAILSLALAIGACTATFRLVDALLLRPLPVAGTERLYAVAFQGVSGMDGAAVVYDSSSYPMFERMRDAVRGRADVFGVSYAERSDLTYGGDAEMEKAHRQFVSGSMFPVFGLQPALGRLFTAQDDRTPGGHPVAVLSHEYWMRRFAGDRGVVGRTFRLEDKVYEITGVASPGFTGTETGTMTDIFLPMMMGNPASLKSYNNFWLRTMVELHPGVDAEPVRAELSRVFREILVERAAGLPAMTKQQRDRYFRETMLLEPAVAGRSNLQREYGEPLGVLGGLVVLVLLIACANVANLMTARAAARSREMALRVSIGAGRGRLVQLVLVESAMVALAAAGIGALLAWQAAPWLVGLLHSADGTTRLDLPGDGRMLAFSVVLTFFVTVLFGLPPALRAAGVEPSGALKGGTDPRTRGRRMHVLIAAQVAFCCVVLFAAGLFLATFDRLSHQPLGYRAERLINLETLTRTPQAPVYWEQIAEGLRGMAGVEAVGMTGWPTMSGEGAVSTIAVNGGPPAEVFSDVVYVSPRWMETMGIGLLDGRDFREEDVNPRTAIVNQAFARQYFDGANPVGRTFERVDSKGGRVRVEIAGYVPDVRSRDRMRVPIRPTFYFPMRRVNPAGELQGMGRATFVVRTAAARPGDMAGALRQAVAGGAPGFRVSNVRTQVEIVESKTVRERMLAMLALFFAVVAAVLAGVGLYGVLDYSVLQRRREIGIRMAIGAMPGDIAGRVLGEALGTILVGAAAGVVLGAVSVRFLESLLYRARGTEWAVLVWPCAVILVVSFLGTLPAVVRAVRVQPVEMLRTE